MINPEIREILSEFKIPYDDGVSYLLAVFYNLDPSYIPDTLKKKVIMARIFEVGKTGVDWRTPLMEEQMTSFGWVKEYVQVFKRLNPDLPGSVTESTKRFKKFFADNPNVTIQDVKGAVNLYIGSVNDYRYLMYPHYFISKGVGADKTSMLESWLEKYLEGSKQASNRISKSNTMQ